MQIAIIYDPDRPHPSSFKPLVVLFLSLIVSSSEVFPYQITAYSVVDGEEVVAI